MEQAIQSLFRGASSGLLRGACHRARIRATRWLAMTDSRSGTAQFDSPRPVLFAKIFPFPPDPNQIYIPRRPAPHRGVSRSSRTRGGMRWTRAVRLTKRADADGGGVSA